MNDFGYPRYTPNQRQGKKGESFFDYFVHTHLGWIYRSVPQESDFGIDGYIDIATDSFITGQTLAVQIKCGDSYFNKRSAGGIRYEGEKKHLNYYLNSRCPVILLVLNEDCSEGEWAEFDINATSETKGGWWLEIPDRNSLEALEKSVWEAIAGPAEDFSSSIARNWKINEIFDKSDFGIYHVTKDEILECDFSGINSFFKRLSRNKESLIKNRGTLEILVNGYDDDSREIYEIPEVRRWYSESIKAGIPWFYFLGLQADGMGLTATLLSTCDVTILYERDGQYFVEFDEPEQISEWLVQNFRNLNHFTGFNDISLEINKEMSQRAATVVQKFVPDEEL